MKLTIGMAAYGDLSGIFSTVQSLRMHHDLENYEILIIDNKGIDSLEKWVKSWGAPNVRYEKYTEITGTTVPRQMVFEMARGEYILCIDAHVLLLNGALNDITKYMAEGQLIHGPLIVDNLVSYITHMDPVWRDNMWGIWGPAIKAEDLPKVPFEIPMHGLGLFGCKKDAWLGFNKKCRGFGGEEGYIHEKFRKAGRKVLCIPWLKWNHNFLKENGTPYLLNLDDRIRNYLINFAEINLDPKPIYEHFGNEKVSKIVNENKIVFNTNSISKLEKLTIIGREKAEGVKYDYLYSTGYPAGGVGGPISWAGTNKDHYKILDIACGWGILSDLYHDYTGIDVSGYVIEENKKIKEGIFIQCGASQAYKILPQNKWFDYAFAIDFLEHIQTEDVYETLKNISKINAKYFLFSICCRESGYKDKDGNGLHLTVWDKEQWIEALNKYFKVIKSSDYNRQKTFYILLEKPIKKNVLLIGNGPSALSKEMGDEIDNYDGLVVRFNDYKVKHFENFLGSRIDIWSTCIPVSRHMHNDYYQTLFVTLLMDHQKDKNFEVIKDNIPDAKRIPYESLCHTKKGMGFNMPSSGAVITDYFLDRGYEVELWGFDLMQGGKHHYGDNQAMGNNHSPYFEAKYFNGLLDQKKIKFFKYNPHRESFPAIRQPVQCGTNENLSLYREPTQNSWYEWFGKLSKGASVLDVGSGMCEGLNILAKSASMVKGFETDIRLEGIHNDLIIGNDLSIFEDKSFDVITCIDVIEHVIDDIMFMKHLLRIAREKVFISTPNYTRSKCGNFAHCREYTISQFWNIFRPSRLWSAAPDGSIHKTLLLEKSGNYIIDHSNEGPENKNHVDNLVVYKNNVPSSVKFNQTVDGEEWPHICAIFNLR